MRNSALDTTMRRLSHLLRVQEAKAAQLKANEELKHAVDAARAGGCDDFEVKSAIGMIERATRA